jgi:hypothetical protein
MPTQHISPQHSLQSQYEQQPNFRYNATSDDRARGRTCSAFHYSTRSEYYPPSSKAHMNTASKLGPHTKMDRGTCPGVKL